MANTAQSALSPEFAPSIRETLLYWAARKLETTKKVLAAIPVGPTTAPIPMRAPRGNWHGI